MTLATFLIALGMTLLAVGVALPIAYGIRLRAAARPSPRMQALHRAPTPQFKRVSA